MEMFPNGLRLALRKNVKYGDGTGNGKADASRVVHGHGPIQLHVQMDLRMQH